MSDPEAGPSHSTHRPQRGMVHGGREAVFEGAEALDPALMADDPAGGYSYGGSVTAPGTGTGTGAGSTGGSASGSGSHTGNGTENGQSRSHTQSPAAGQYQYPYPGDQGNIVGANVSPSAQSAQDGTSHPPGSAHSQGQASASGSGAGAIGQEGQISVMGEDGLVKRVGGKANVSSACGPCKRAHLACDIGRPCKRCVNLGKEAQCEDVPHKKRGRPKVIKPTIGQQQYARLRADVAPGPGSPGAPPSAGAEYGRWRMQPPPYGHGHGHGPPGYMHGPPPPGPSGSYGQPPYAPTGSMPPPPPGAPMNGHGHGAYAHPHASGPGGPPMAGPGSAGLGPGPGGMPPAGMPPGSVAYRGPPPPAEEEPYPPTLFTAFTTPDLRVIRVSSAVTYLTGYHSPEFTNLNLLDWVHRDDRHLLDMERARLIDEPFGPGTLRLDREHHMAALHRPDRDLLSPAAGMREPYPNQNIRFMRPDQQFSHFNARLHLGGALGGSLWSPESFDRVYLVISFLLLPPSNSAPTSAPPTAAPAQPPAGPVAHQGPMRISASGREYAVPAPLTIAPDSRRSSLLGYPPPTPMTPGAHQPMSTAPAAAAMTPTSLTGTTPGTAGMPTVPAAGTITPGGPLSAAPTAPPGNLPSFSSVAAGSDSPTFKVDNAHVHANAHAHGPQSGYYTPTTAGPSISVSAPPSAVAPGRASGPMSLGSAMASPGMSMAQVQAQAHAQNQAQQHHEAQTQAQHHQQQQHLRHPQYPHAQHQAAQGHPHSQASHAAHNGAPGYQYDRPPTGIYDNRTPSPAHSQSQSHPPSLALDPALAPNGGPYAHSSSRMNGSHPSGPAQNHDPPPSASATSAGGYVDYPPPLQLQQPYYAHDGRYEYRRESDWVPRDAHAQGQGQGQVAHEAAMSAGGVQMEARGMEQARQAQGLAAGETSPGSGEYGRRPWE